MSQPQPPPLPPPPKAPMNKWLKRALWTAAALPAVLALAWLTLAYLARSNLESILARLRANGYATRIEQMAQPKVPDSDNAAPLYYKAYHGLPEEWYSTPLGYLNSDGLSSVDAEQREEIRNFLKDHDDALADLKAARLKKFCRFDCDYSTETLLTDWPWYTGLEPVTKLLHAKAETAAASGDDSEAREAVHSMIALADGLGRAPLVGCQGVRVSILNSALDLVERHVTSRTGAEDLRDWLKIVPAPSSLDGLAERALRADLAMLAQISVDLSVFHLDRDEPRIEKGNSLYSTLVRPLYDHSYSRNLERIERCMGILEQPLAIATAEFSGLEFEHHGHQSILDPVAEILSPSTSLLDNQVRLQARLATVRAGLRFEIERAETGVYPSEVKTTNPHPHIQVVYNAKQGQIQADGPPKEWMSERSPWTLRHPPRK